MDGDRLSGPFRPGLSKDTSGKTSKIYVMAVARDGWGKLNDNQWTLAVVLSDPTSQDLTRKMPYE